MGEALLLQLRNVVLAEISGEVRLVAPSPAPPPAPTPVRPLPPPAAPCRAHATRTRGLADA